MMLLVVCPIPCPKSGKIDVCNQIPKRITGTRRIHLLRILKKKVTMKPSGLFDVLMILNNIKSDDIQTNLISPDVGHKQTAH